MSTLEHLLKTNASFAAPKDVRQSVPDYASEMQRATNPDAFWEEWAKKFTWFSPWSKVSAFDFPDHQWFVGGTTNIAYNCLDRHLATRGNKTALVWLGEDGATQRFSYAQLADLVSRFGAVLQGLGVGALDRVVIYMPLTVEGVVAMLACARIGAVHSVVYAGLGVGALRERIVDTGAKLIVAGDIGVRRGKNVDLRGIVREATAGLGLTRVWFRRDATTPLEDNDLDWADLLGAQQTGCEAVAVDSEHPLYILYTSGSTGKPKGVVHVHGGYMVGTSYHLRTFWGAQDHDVFWSTSDIGWIVGHSYIVYGPLLEGLTTVIREGAPDYPNPGAVWDVVASQGVTLMFTAPTAIRMFMKFGTGFVEGKDLSSLRMVAVAGEPLNPEAWHWAWQHVAQNGTRAFVADNWWQTELGSLTIGTPPSLPAKPGSVGVALPGAEVAVVNEHGEEVAPDTGGLLVIKRPFPHMMRTIWGDHERYRQYWLEIPGRVYAAGDVASRDQDGYITVLGRADDVLNVAGHRIGTADVESALVSHAFVAEAAVIGVPDDLKGEAIKAFVTLRAGQTWGADHEETLKNHVRHELGPIATPQAVVCLEKLPKTRSGKILRRLLKAQELGRDPGDVSTLEE